jgi:tRNA (cytidine/uridine-2'-O-)-methyltransferase
MLHHLPDRFTCRQTREAGERGRVSGLAWGLLALHGARMRIALFEPEIAGNVGAVLRLGACLGAAIDLIEPMGFTWDDRRVRRAAMDYIDHVTFVRHSDFDAFRSAIGPSRLVLFTTKARQSAYEFEFRPDDVLLFGKESAGVPAYVAEACTAGVRLPMRPGVRSMNLAMSAAVALGEALRQTASLPGHIE